MTSRAAATELPRTTGLRGNAAICELSAPISAPSAHSSADSRTVIDLIPSFTVTIGIEPFNTLCELADVVGTERPPPAE
jgi:hypothetical protein